jgi:EmrB/QacA subfamily drug resistance transporter
MSRGPLGATRDGRAQTPRPDRRSWTLGIVGLAWFLVLVDDTAAAIALPSVGRDLDLGLAGLEWVVNIYTLAFAVLTLAGGAATDRYGARPVFLTGLTVFTAASLAAGLSANGGMLIGMRAAQGAGAALMGPAALAMLLASFTGRRRALALGVWAGVGATALASGPLVGAVLTRNLGWQSIFWVNVPLGVVMLLVARFAAPAAAAPSAARQDRLDVAGLLTSALGLSALVFGLTQASTWGWTSPALWAILGVAAASLAMFLVVERRALAPLLDLTLLRRANVLAANILALLNLAVMCSLFFFLSLYLQLVAGASPLRAGVVLLPLTVLGALVAPLAGWLVPHTGARPLIAAGMAATAAGLALLTRIDPGWTTWQVLPGLLLAGAGIGLASTPITTAAMGDVPDRQAGIAAAAHNAFRMIGLSLGVAVMGAVVAARWPGDLAQADTDPAAFTAGISAGFAVNAAIALAAAALAIATIRTRPTTRQPAAPTVGVDNPARPAAPPA